MAQVAQEMGIRQLTQVERNAHGTPLIRSIFDLARQNGTGRLLAYVNADILLLPDFVRAAQQIMQQAQRFLVVGQRWDLDVRQEIDFSSGWDARLREWVAREGKLHPPMGSDYFIFPPECFQNLPPMAVGRAGWDNWMLYEGRRNGWAVVDASQDVLIIHQNHDYSHLPNGQPHYRLPETDENVRLGGGKLTIFTLRDVSRRLSGGKLARMSPGWKRFWREVEIFPLVRLNSKPLGWLFFAFFHPYKAYGLLRRRLVKQNTEGSG